MSPTAAVNRPTDVKLKEQDVNNKLQLFGIYSAFANGKVPSNKQIDIALNSALASKPFATTSKKLSPEGQKLVGDLKNVIEQAKILVLTKNQGNLLQDFIWQTQQVSAQDATVPNAPVDKETARQHGNEALEGLRTLGTLIISNGQFRKLLTDAQVILRDMVGDAATNVAGKVNPTEGQLASVDHPADDNTWHDVPDFSKDNVKGQFQNQWQKQKPFGRAEAEKAAREAQNASGAPPADAHPEEFRDRDIDAQQGAAAGGQTLRDAASENIPEETKERQRKYADKSREYWDKKMPKERRDQTIYRLKKMVIEIQGHQDYMRAIETLLRLAEQYASHGKTVAQQGHGSVKGAHTDDSLTNAEANLRTLIERFANGTSLDDLFESINQIYRDAQQDPDLRQWFKDIDTYIRRTLKEQGFIMEQASTDQWNELNDRGRFLLRDRYRSHTDRVLDEFKFIGNQFDADPQNTAFATSLTNLFNDLGNDENGKPKFKKHLVKDLTDVILPGIFESVRYVPVPRIEYSDPMIDAIVENLVIESDNLAPNVLEFGSDNYWRWGRKKISNKNKNKVMLSVSGIQMDLRDVSYYVKRKQGSPKLTDTGVADIFLGGNGLSFKVEMETADKASKAHLVKVNKVSVDIKNMTVKLKKSNHKLLFALFKPLLLKLLRPALEKVIEKVIKDNITQFDELAYKVQTEAKKAEADFKSNPDPENVQNIYQRYMSAAQKEFLQGKQKTEEFTADKKVNVAVTQHDSIFKNISLPGGISTKATEFKELAAKGDKWESPVFGIGSAGETRELPTFPKVTRKPHGPSTTTGNTGTTSHTGTTGLTGNGNPGHTGHNGGKGGLTNDAQTLGQNMDQSFGMSEKVNGKYPGHYPTSNGVATTT